MRIPSMLICLNRHCPALQPLFNQIPDLITRMAPLGQTVSGSLGVQRLINPNSGQLLQ